MSYGDYRYFGGQLNDGFKPTRTVELFMFDEYLRQVINNQIEKFNEQIAVISKNMKIDLARDIAGLRIAQKKIIQEMNALRKVIRMKGKQDDEMEDIKIRMRKRGFKVA